MLRKITIFHLKCIQRLNPAPINVSGIVIINNEILHYANRNPCLKSSWDKRYLCNQVDTKKTHSMDLNYFSLESSHARNIIMESKGYCNSLPEPVFVNESEFNDIQCLLKQNWNDMSNVEIIKNIKLFYHYRTKHKTKIIKETDFKNTGLRDILARRCVKFSDNELFELLNYLSCWTDYENFEEFWKILDEECLRRYKKWHINNVLLMIDHFAKLGIPTVSKFPETSLNNIDLENIGPTNFVQIAYLLKVYPINKYDFHCFEHILEKHFDSLSIEELGIVAIAFFKYRTTIKKPNLLSKLLRVLKENLISGTISNVCLAGILKMFRYSMLVNETDEIDTVLKLLVPGISNYTLSCITHIAHFKATQLHHNSELMNKIIERFQQRIKTARLKDIERLLFALFTFNYPPKDNPIYYLIARELMNPARDAECDEFPSVLSYAVLYMLQVNFFPQDLVKRVLSPEFINKIRQRNSYKIGREYLAIDYCIEIEHPEYNGPRLPSSLRKFIISDYSNYLAQQKLLQKNNMAIIHINHLFQQILGYEFCYVDQVLPHFIKNQIVLCYNPEERKFVPPKTKLQQLPENTIKYAPDDGNIWYAITAIHNNMMKNENKPTGVLAMQLRQMECIGYVPMWIPFQKWRKNNLATAYNFLNNMIMKDSVYTSKCTGH